MAKKCGNFLKICGRSWAISGITGVYSIPQLLNGSEWYETPRRHIFNCRKKGWNEKRQAAGCEPNYSCEEIPPVGRGQLARIVFKRTKKKKRIWQAVLPEELGMEKLKNFNFEDDLVCHSASQPF